MAKKIIKEPTIRRYRATCPICGCEFEFDTTDANWDLRTPHPTMWGGLICDEQKVCYVSCPTCKTTLSNMQTEIGV